MLSRVLREHQTKQIADKVNSERLEREAVAGVTAAYDVLADTLSVRVTAAFKSQREIEAEAKRLQTAAAQYDRQSREWLKLVEEFNAALKVASVLWTIAVKLPDQTSGFIFYRSWVT